MRFRLTPGDELLSDVRPSGGQHRHCGQLLDELASQDVNGALVKKMKDIEHQGDDVTHDIMRRLNLTFVTPFDREDIYTLASRLDDISWTLWRNPSRSGKSSTKTAYRPQWPIKLPSCSGWLS